MSWLDMVPVVSQAKAGLQYVTGDKEGASRTADRFVTRTPILAHMHAGIAKAFGNHDLARKCWDGGNSSLNVLPVVGHVKGLGHYAIGDVPGGHCAMKTATSATMGIMDSVPVVGHVKGGVHYAFGNNAAGHHSMISATRTTTVMGAGAGGFVIGGPAGSVALGVGAGAQWDLVTAHVTGERQMNGICRVIENPRKVDAYFDAGLSIFSDGLTGFSGGKAAERIVNTPEIHTGDVLRTIRDKKGLPRGGQGDSEVSSEGKDTTTSVNESVCTAYDDPASRPNEFLQPLSQDSLFPLQQCRSSSCAEAQALHELVVDPEVANPSTLNIESSKLEVSSEEDIYTMSRSDNGMAYEDGVEHRWRESTSMESKDELKG